jgi:hypothetical protein
MTEAEREEAFREFHAEHLRRQTRALESIRGILVFFTILFVIGAAIYITLAASAASRF